MEVFNQFEFDSIVFPYSVHDAIVIRDDTPIFVSRYISDNFITKAKFIRKDLEILNHCPNLQYLEIFPSIYASNGFDFSPLYDLEEIKHLHCITAFGPKMQHKGNIDYSKINNLVSLTVTANKNNLNFNTVETLKTLRIGEYKNAYKTLEDMFCSTILDTLELNHCGIRSLRGIDVSKEMQCLYLLNNRTLQDISDIRKISGTLKALRINRCPDIQDFSVLEELENLELLELTGNNVIPNLDFIKHMKNLKTFVFNANVLDGNLFPCMNLSYVYSEVDRKHYNIKDANLPKGIYVRGNENIEMWRHLE